MRLSTQGRFAVLAVPVLTCILLVCGGPARAQDWREYAYPEAGFSAHFPAQPTVSEIQFSAGDLTAPARTYTVAQGSSNYSVVVADLSTSSVAQDAAIEQAVKGLSAAGQVKLDVRARIDRQFGRELSLQGKTGEQMTTAVFYVGKKLYVLVGRTEPTDSGLAVRFQQSLQFIGADGRPPRRPEDGPGPGGQGFRGRGFGPPTDDGDGEGRRRRRPPPEAFTDCQGKSQGEVVQFQTPRGDVVPAVCVQTPEGLAARPNRRPRGGPSPEGSPPEGESPPDGPPPAG
ncbi:MAG TPA: hypothetical protein VGM25_04075 [Caulobacteraceae bacterium]